MKKSNILIISAAAFLAIYFYNLNSEVSSGSSALVAEETIQNTENSLSTAHDHNHEQSSKAVLPKAANVNREVQSESVVSKKDYNQEIKNIDKVAKSKNFKDELFNVIVSKNPYKDKVREPHTVNAHLFQQEAALRVHAMKHLDAQLKTKAEDYKATFTRIMKTADDNTLRTIASEALDYQKKGRSLFKDMKAGIRQMQLPE